MECYYHNFPSIQYNLHPVLLCFTIRFLQYPCTMYCFAMFYRQISAISLYHVLFCYVYRQISAISLYHVLFCYVYWQISAISLYHVLFCYVYWQISAISLSHVLFCYVLPSDFCNITVPCIVLLCLTVRFLQYPFTMYCFAMFTIRFLQYSCIMYCFVTIFPDPKKNIKNKDNWLVFFIRRWYNVREQGHCRA